MCMVDSNLIKIIIMKGNMIKCVETNKGFTFVIQGNKGFCKHNFKYEL